MHDSIPKNFNQTGESGNGRKTTGGWKGRRPAYCWSFNRGEKYRFKPNCKFIKHCSYCDASGHGQFECTKLKEKRNGGNKQ